MIDWTPDPDDSKPELEESTTATDNDNHKDSFSSINTLLQEWDPMGQDSKGNSSNGQFHLPAPLEIGETPCPFQKEPWKPCYKGLRCEYKHGAYTPAMVSGKPKLQPRPSAKFLLAKNLPLKDPLPSGLVTLAYVTCVKDPWEFYVVLKEAKCLCKVNEEEHEDQGLFKQYGTSSSFKRLENVHKSMQINNEKNSPFYYAGELVGVRYPLQLGDNVRQPKKAWFRAVVLEDTNPDLENIFLLRAKLLDYGTEVIIDSLEDVAMLGEKWGKEAPMAYNLSLHGISPLVGKWRPNSKGTKFFKELLSSKIVLIEVMRPSIPSEDSLFFDTFDQCPTEVKVYVKDGKSFINVAKAMGEKGYGIEWNPFPLRPWVNEEVNAEEVSFAVKDFKGEKDLKDLGDKMKVILERESDRLRKSL